MSQRDVIILINHGSHRIATSRRSIASQSQSGTTAHEEGTDYRSHERLIVKQRSHAHGVRLDESGCRRKDSHAIDGLGTEFPPQNTESNEQQKHVEHQISNRSRYTEAPTDNRGNTSYSTHRDMVWNQEDVESDTTFYHGKSNDDVVAKLVHFCFSRHCV